MAAVVRMDEMVKDYLLYRGLTATLRALEIELKNEKDKGFREFSVHITWKPVKEHVSTVPNMEGGARGVDRIVDQLQSYVSSYELVALRDYWSYLDQRIFCRLEQVYTSSVRRLEVSLLKYYVVNAVQSGRPDKVSEFFEKLAPELQHQSEWKEWFVLPFIRTPEDSNTFAVYFTRQWQETFLVSLHNFFSVIFQNMLLNFEEDSRRLVRLQEENSLYRHQLGKTLERREVELLLRQVDSIENSQHVGGGGGGGGITSMDLMDDFFVISQDTTLQDKEEPETKTNNIRSFIKNIGLPSSPIVSKKGMQGSATSGKKSSGKDDAQQSQARTKVKGKPAPTASLTGQGSGATAKDESEVKGPRSEAGSQAKVKEKIEAPKTEAMPANLDVMTTADVTSMPSSFMTSQATKRQSPGVSADVPDGGGLVLLSQEEYAEHRSSIIQCRFSNSGHYVATSDVDGVVKIWGQQPHPVTLATIMAKSMFLSLEWAGSKDRLLLLGNKAGNVKLFDVKEKKTIKEETSDSSFPRIISLSANPVEPSFVVSAAVRGRGGGKLAVWDLNTMKPKQNLALAPAPTAVNYTTYNKSGQLLLTGAADGMVRLYDLRRTECVASWNAHAGEVYTSLFAPDESTCYSMGADGKFAKWSLQKPGLKMADLSVHQGACGPFVLTGAAGYRQVQTPKGKLFSLDSSGDYVLTCAPKGGLIYKLTSDAHMNRLLTLSGHVAPVVTVDWSAAEDCRVCLTGAMDGKVRVSTLLLH